MGEIKKKLNIKKISAKNILLLLLVVVVVFAMSVISKSLRGKSSGITGINSAQACWDAPVEPGSGGCECGCEGCGSEGSEGG